MSRLIELLREPSLRGIDFDGEARLRQHRSILARKGMIREVFQECHSLLHAMDRIYLTGCGVAIEVGAGVAPMRDSFRDVLSTDVVAASHLDFVADAQQLGLRHGSVRVIYAQNAFHHFPQPERFLAEVERVLCNGGGAILLEPYYGPLASLVFKRLFRSERFDKSSQRWDTPMTGPMSGANQALSYIIFVRDRTRFEREFPSLKIVHTATIGNYLRYLASGGLNFRSLLPDGMSGGLRLAERALAPFNTWLALHHVIVIRKECP